MKLITFLLNLAIARLLKIEQQQEKRIANKEKVIEGFEQMIESAQTDITASLREQNTARNLRNKLQGLS